jgi:hypothetical protein
LWRHHRVLRPLPPPGDVHGLNEVVRTAKSWRRPSSRSSHPSTRSSSQLTAHSIHNSVAESPIGGALGSTARPRRTSRARGSAPSATATLRLSPCSSGAFCHFTKRQCTRASDRSGGCWAGATVNEASPESPSRILNASHSFPKGTLLYSLLLSPEPCHTLLRLASRLICGELTLPKCCSDVRSSGAVREALASSFQIPVSDSRAKWECFWLWWLQVSTFQPGRPRRRRMIRHPSPNGRFTFIVRRPKRQKVGISVSSPSLPMGRKMTHIRPSDRGFRSGSRSAAGGRLVRRLGGRILRRRDPGRPEPALRAGGGRAEARGNFSDAGHEPLFAEFSARFVGRLKLGQSGDASDGQSAVVGRWLTPPQSR